MPLTELRQKRKSNSEAYASESDVLALSYPQVLSASVFLIIKLHTCTEIKAPFNDLLFLYAEHKKINNQLRASHVTRKNSLETKPRCLTCRN